MTPRNSGLVDAFLERQEKVLMGKESPLWCKVARWPGGGFSVTQCWAPSAHPGVGQGVGAQC